MASPITCSGDRSPRVASGGDPPTPCTRSSVTPLEAASAASCTLGNATECRGRGISDLHPPEGRHVHRVLDQRAAADGLIHAGEQTLLAARVDEDLRAFPGADLP